MVINLKWHLKRYWNILPHFVMKIDSIISKVHIWWETRKSLTSFALPILYWLCSKFWQTIIDIETNCFLLLTNFKRRCFHVLSKSLANMNRFGNSFCKSTYNFEDICKCFCFIKICHILVYFILSLFFY